jgi:hypothetical protein
MPTSLPVKTVARAPQASRTIEPMDIWAVSLAVVMTGLATFVYLSTGDSGGAALILAAAAAVIMMELRIAANADDPG